MLSHEAPSRRRLVNAFWERLINDAKGDEVMKTMCRRVLWVVVFLLACSVTPVLADGGGGPEPICLPPWNC